MEKKKLKRPSRREGEVHVQTDIPGGLEQNFRATITRLNAGRPAPLSYKVYFAEALDAWVKANKE